MGVTSNFTMLLAAAAVLIPFLVIVVLGFYCYIWARWGVSRPSSPKTYAFFHPYCSGGGGGERVLWKMVQLLQQQDKQVIIYTIDPPDTDEVKLRKDAERRFDIRIPQPVHLVSLEEYKDYLLPQPFLSLVLESWGTMKLAYQGFKKYPSPDVYCDTTGCAFTFLVARWMAPSAWIMAYVHYPTISTDMMAWEWKQTHRSRLKTMIKLIYYCLFAAAYGFVGSLADLVMVNSTWTYNHIHRLWLLTKRIDIVYPPCRVELPKSGADSDIDRSPNIVSIGQFRPEKDHTLQVESFARLLQKYPQHKANGSGATGSSVKLILVGSCRNEDDQRRVDKLKQLVQERDLSDSVVFSINVPYSELQQTMRTSSIGIHTMRQEHFGIGIVELMAAGLLVIAHNSGGPKTDIIVEPGCTGFLATTVGEYADAMHTALTLEEPENVRQRAQASAMRFSDQVFDDALTSVLPKLLER